MNKIQRILLALLVVQITIVAWIYWPQSDSAALGTKLLDINSPADVLIFAIEDNEGNQITLNQRGGVWILPDADDYPADSLKITPVLEKITAIDTDRLITRTSGSHKRLQVADDDFQRRVYLELSSGDSLILYIGSSAGSGSTHVRLAGQSEVYQTNEVTSWEFGASASTWIDPAYLSVPTETVLAATIQNANGTFEFEVDTS
jgi:hypothetical protein